MSEQETRIEELERPAEELTEHAAAEVRGAWTLQAGATNPGQVSGNTSDSTRQTRQTSIVQDL